MISRTSTTVVILLAGLLVACTSTKPVQVSEQPAEVTANAEVYEDVPEIALVPAVPPRGSSESDEVVCVMDTITTTHLPSERCRTRDQRRQEAHEAQEWMRTNGANGNVGIVQF